MTSDPLADAHALGAERWPGVVIDHDRFAFVTARCGELELAVVRCDQLYLTCACTVSDPLALATFERTFGPVIDSALVRMANAVTDADEIKQQVRERLFVGSAETPPRIHGARRSRRLGSRGRRSNGAELPPDLFDDPSPAFEPDPPAPDE
jgi:hypothetical protein